MKDDPFLEFVTIVIIFIITPFDIVTVKVTNI